MAEDTKLASKRLLNVIIIYSFSLPWLVFFVVLPIAQAISLLSARQNQAVGTNKAFESCTLSADDAASIQYPKRKVVEVAWRLEERRVQKINNMIDAVLWALAPHCCYTVLIANARCCDGATVFIFQLPYPPSEFGFDRGEISQFNEFIYYLIWSCNL